MIGAPSRLVFASVLILALGHVLPPTARAEVRVAGRMDSVSVDAREATVQEVLEALRAAFGWRLYSSATLDQPISGTYEGSLQQVVAQLLAGHDYVASYSADTVEIRIFAPRHGASEPVAGTPSAPSPPHAAAPVPAGSSFADKARRVFLPR